MKTMPKLGESYREPSIRLENETIAAQSFDIKTKTKKKSKQMKTHRHETHPEADEASTLVRDV